MEVNPMTTLEDLERKYRELENSLRDERAERRSQEAVRKVYQRGLMIAGAALLAVLGYTSVLHVPREVRAEVRAQVGPEVEEQLGPGVVEWIEQKEEEVGAMHAKAQAASDQVAAILEEVRRKEKSLVSREELEQVSGEAASALAIAKKYGVKDLHWSSNGFETTHSKLKDGKVRLIETSVTSFSDNYLKVVRP